MKILLHAGALALALFACAPITAQGTPMVGKSVPPLTGSTVIYCDDGSGHTALCSLGAGGGGGDVSGIVTAQGVDKDGISRTLCTDAVGALCAPSAGSSQRSITRTSLSANTSQTVCPAITYPVSTEIEVQSGSVGISLTGASLTTGAYGTTSTSPDRVLAAANGSYTLAIPSTNAITAYSSTAQIVLCIQTVRP